MIGNALFKRVLAVGMIATMIASGFAFSLPSGEASGAPPAATGSKLLRIASQDDAKGLNPFAVNDVWSANIIYNVFDGLVNRDWKTQKNQPWIVVGWKVEDEQPPGCPNCNITVEYKLGDWEERWGGSVYFHDGVKASLDDVLFSYGMTMYNPRWISSVDAILWSGSWSNPPYNDPDFMKVTVYGQQNWLGVKKVDDHTLQFRLVKPYADFFDDTISVVLFPKHIWKDHIDIQTGDGDFLTWDMGYNDQNGEASGMIGSGPFVFEKWIKGQYAQEKKFENVNGVSYFDWTKLPRIDDYGQRLDPEQPAFDPSWTRNHPTPYIDGILFKIYRTTEAVTLAITNEPPEVDFVAWSIPPAMVSDLQKNPNIQLFYTSEPGFFFQAFNMRRKTFGYEDYQKADYTDVGKPFRKAIAYSSDKATIVSKLLMGYGKVGLSPISPDNKIWFNDSLPAYSLNEELARKYLDDAGWKDTDGDGWREFPEIGDAQIELLTPEASYDPIRAVAGQMIETQAKKININLKSIPISFGELQNRVKQRNFQLYILGWRIGGSDPGFLYNFFHCSQGNAQNDPGYCNKAVDDMLDEYRESFDNVKRVRLIKDVQGILVDDLPYNVLYFRTNIEATRKDKFTGWTQGASGIYNGWSLLLVDTPKELLRTAFVNTRDKVISGQVVDLSVQSRDKNGIPASNADMQIKIDTGSDVARLTVRDGYPATTDGVVINGRTDTGGFFKARLETNVNMNETRSVYLNALAFKEGYNQETLTIFEIKVTIDQYILIIDQFDIDPDTILAGETSMVTIRVIDGKGIPVPNALVKFETLFGAVNPTSTSTAQDGKVNVIYSIPKDAEVPENGISVDLIADAEAILGGQTVKDTCTRSLTVNPIPRPPGTELPWLTIIVILIAIVAVVAIIIYLKRKR